MAGTAQIIVRTPVRAARSRLTQAAASRPQAHASAS